jgi:hypothetical protein
LGSYVQEQYVINRKRRDKPKMGRWATRPWDSDSAADWFGEMMEKTGLAKYIEETLHREIDDGFPGDADEIRAAASVLVLLGHIYVWPVEERDEHLKLAISRLEEILAKDYGGSCTAQIQAEIAALRSRLEENALNRPERVKWWHFDE